MLHRNWEDKLSNTTSLCCLHPSKKIIPHFSYNQSEIYIFSIRLEVEDNTVHNSKDSDNYTDTRHCNYMQLDLPVNPHQ